MTEFKTGDMVRFRDRGQDAEGTVTDAWTEDGNELVTISEPGSARPFTRLAASVVLIAQPLPGKTLIDKVPANDYGTTGPTYDPSAPGAARTDATLLRAAAGIIRVRWHDAQLADDLDRRAYVLAPEEG